MVKAPQADPTTRGCCRPSKLPASFQRAG